MRKAIRIKKNRNSNLLSKFFAVFMSLIFIIGIFPIQAIRVLAATMDKEGTSETKAVQSGDTISLKNNYFDVQVGKYGQIKSLKIVGDKFPTNYVMNEENSPEQVTSGHEWMGELMFQTKVGDGASWVVAKTNSSDSARKVTLDGNKVVVTYENAKEANGIKNFKLVETYSLVNDKLRWEIKLVNTNDKKLTIGDLGVPLAFNEKWPGGEEIYETRTVYHSFVGKDSSYVYATRPSGIGQFLLLTPDTSTGAGFEYQDHWRTDERSKDEAAWCQDQAGWANGLNVFYIHSAVIKATNRGYLDNTSLVLAPGEEKTYAFNFSAPQNEDNMKKILYDEGLIDAVSVPGMTFSVNMPGKLYLHTKVPKENISFDIKGPNELNLFKDKPKTISNNLPSKKTPENTYVKYNSTKVINDESYLIYDIAFADLGQNNVTIKYYDKADTNKEKQKQTVLQFYMMDSVTDALGLHSNFMVDKTQYNSPGQVYDKVFDDWMMDTKSKRNKFDGYWGWGDDWGLTHGEFLAEKNVYQPVVKEIKALDEYLNTAIWNGLMREHHEDYKVHDFLMAEPNTTPTYRGYAYPHIYNTYFSMYKIADKYPELIPYKEKASTYLLRAYNIIKALYGDGVSYNWETGLMGELTTPAIIEALEKEGYYNEAKNLKDIMAKKYANFKNTKYPYGSEYSYDNTGEEAVYTLAKLNNAVDTANSNSIMEKIDEKTRACRGLQPVWYHYANPTTICGENWWNFQYSASLAGYTMDDWLRLQNNGKSSEESAAAERVNYAAKLANLTAINSGQIDADPQNIGTVAWTYQSEKGNLGGQGVGDGNLHNGWRQMSGEADLGLFGALQILSSDVATDPVFGLFGYGCNVKDNGNAYEVTPLDGLYTKLNFINQKLYIELDRDQYTKAVVNKDSSNIILNMKNLTKTSHQSELELTGLKKGSYEVSVDGKTQGSFQALDNKKINVPVQLAATDSAVITIKAGSALKNTAPTVEAGKDLQAYISDGFKLQGTAVDDGYPSMNLTYKWSVVTQPDGAKVTIANDDKLITDVKVDKTGDYKFKLTVSDGALESSDTMSVKVLEAPVVPKNLAHYSFDNIDSTNKLVLDDTTAKNNATIVGNTAFAAGKTGNGVLMNGKNTGYVKLTNALTKNVKDFTIDLDVKLNDIQGQNSRILEFGDMNNKYFYLSVINGKELSLTATDSNTGKNNTINTGVVIEKGYWKNVGITLTNNTATLYVDGIKKASLNNFNFTLSSLGEVQRNYLGRSYDENTPFFNGVIDNFDMKSFAMSPEDIKTTYGNNGSLTIVSAPASSFVTEVGKPVELPKTIKALYSDGVYYDVPVKWDAVASDAYSKAGNFKVSGKIDGLQAPVTETIIVVSGKAANLALSATPSAIINTPEDLGGVAALNDNYDPTSSKDTSHGAWHNWHGDQTAKAWVQYNWDNEVILTGMDAYYFTDGNFVPASVEVQYLDQNNAWLPVNNAKGLGVDLNKYNKTTFDPIVTKGIRMIMTPKTLGCGVIEWKVYGYSDKVIIDKQALKVSISQASNLKEALFSKDSWAALQTVLKEASTVLNDAKATQDTVDTITSRLNNAIASLLPLDNNIAFNASASTSFCSSWETITAVNDNIVSATSKGDDVKHYGTWGNSSTEESVTYSWTAPMDITSTKLYLFNDGGGILSPKSYKYEYLAADGKWLPVNNAKGYGLELDKYNETTFDKLTTTGFRITMVKSGDGVGIIEWKVLGEKNKTIVDKTALQNVINTALTKIKADYTEASWNNFAIALDSAQKVLKDSNATNETVNQTKTTLESAIKALALAPVIPKVDKSKLQALINKVAQTQSTDYTKESWNSLQAELAKANNIISDPKAQQQAIDNEASALQKAMDGLVKNSSSNGSNTNNGGNSNNNNNGGTNGNTGNNGSNSGNSSNGSGNSSNNSGNVNNNSNNNNSNGTTVNNASSNGSSTKGQTSNTVNSTGTNTAAAMPKTGSPIGTIVLIVVGAAMLLAGAGLLKFRSIRKKLE
ncbi:DUF5695 domain-containing protein [Clostridium manihotivorum]|uniref:Bacterial Ig-like domain-containing protein n=1 Tax=Clostridium manihotivorum TaxID=2320868 RepID=A0A3R5V8H4_9CLOT|nr:DUF5695 domain-containing protein [Clostridium manihotivorum]QAA32629.1 hypothetical protein C1I91_13835 [Clostridium manihotivorum]